ncbi:MAG TPA: APC family permease [Vicinamibacteria bacterium]|nr:APC family permease [Vicinamibacteria bacterium]
MTPELTRAIGRWTLAALVLNGVIGSGIFGLPDDIARLVGPAAPEAYLLAALGIGVVMAVFAEVASQFRDAGGPYLYARAAFGPFVGIQMGWFAWLVRLTSAAANANLFVVYLGEFWPAATRALPRAIVLTAMIWSFALVNVRGVSAGAGTSNLFTVAKLLPLGIFIVAGVLFSEASVTPAPVNATGDDWFQAALALVFAYGGFEAAMMPMSEAKNPRRDAPFALFTGLLAVAAIYTLVHVVTMYSVEDLAASQRPLADAARTFLGPWGASFIALGAMVSTSGWLAGSFVNAPRLTYAFAERGDFPRPFAAVHRRFRTPHVSILVYAALVWGLALYGSFIWNAILSAVARVFTYAVVCAALLRLRRRDPTADALRLPLGSVLALLGIGLCVLMVAQMNAEHAKIVSALAAVATFNWLLAAKQDRKPR